MFYLLLCSFAFPRSVHYFLKFTNRRLCFVRTPRYDAIDVRARVPRGPCGEPGVRQRARYSCELNLCPSNVDTHRFLLMQHDGCLYFSQLHYSPSHLFHQSLNLPFCCRFEVVTSGLRWLEGDICELFSGALVQKQGFLPGYGQCLGFE